MNFAHKLALAVSVSLASLATSAVAQSDQQPLREVSKDGAQLGAFGFDIAGMDTSVSPADDFYLFANGTWAATTPIPADKSNYGMFTALDDLSKDRVKLVLDSEKDRKGSKAGDVYASYLDHAAVEKKGLAPIQPWLKTVRGVQNKTAFEKLMPIAARNGVSALFGGYVGQDDKNPDVYIFQIYQNEKVMVVFFDE
ncbi:MAG: hypothetical protein B7Y00_06515 [Sphingomonadales bacterium 17-56-6]|nr:MAG: hypothetical protein B7Y00_06515 [Sphingomonadales bacterium 17-56-6]